MLHPYVIVSLISFLAFAVGGFGGIYFVLRRVAYSVRAKEVEVARQNATAEAEVKAAQHERDRAWRAKEDRLAADREVERAAALYRQEREREAERLRLMDVAEMTDEERGFYLDNLDNSVYRLQNEADELAKVLATDTALVERTVERLGELAERIDATFYAMNGHAVDDLMSEEESADAHFESLEERRRAIEEMFEEEMAADASGDPVSFREALEEHDGFTFDPDSVEEPEEVYVEDPVDEVPIGSTAPKDVAKSDEPMTPWGSWARGDDDSFRRYGRTDG